MKISNLIIHLSKQIIMINKLIKNLINKYLIQELRIQIVMKVKDWKMWIIYRYWLARSVSVMIGCGVKVVTEIVLIYNHQVSLKMIRSIFQEYLWKMLITKQICRIHFLRIKIYIQIWIFKDVKARKAIWIIIAAKLIGWLINHYQLSL